MTTPARLLFVGLLLATSAAAQIDPTDPRFEEDPRTEGDPRFEMDPRDVEAKEAAAARADPDQLETRELFDVLWEQERFGELALAMQQRPWEVLPYLSRHVTTWQHHARQGELGREAAAEQAAVLRGLAEAADQGILDSHFSGWVDSLLAWDEDDLATAEEARGLVLEAGVVLRNAVDENDLLTALTPLQQAVERSRVLGDVTAQARTLMTVAMIEASTNAYLDSRVTAEEAVRLAHQVRDLDTSWSGLGLVYEVAMADQEFDAAGEALREQYQLALEVGDEAVSDQVLQKLVNLDNMLAGEPTTVWVPRGRTGTLWRPGQRLRLSLGNR